MFMDGMKMYKAVVTMFAIGASFSPVKAEMLACDPALSATLNAIISRMATVSFRCS